MTEKLYKMCNFQILFLFILPENSMENMRNYFTTTISPLFIHIG